MKLKNLWIEEYKNLKDIKIDFEKGNGLTMLIGINGSGKSNILEFISAIFYDDIKKYLGDEETVGATLIETPKIISV